MQGLGRASFQNAQVAVAGLAGGLAVGSFFAPMVSTSSRAVIHAASAGATFDAVAMGIEAIAPPISVACTSKQ